jgi:hypothetical protein
LLLINNAAKFFKITTNTILRMEKSLINAYLETTYIVESLGIEIGIGKENEALQKHLMSHNVATWAFITSENPRSQSYSYDLNRERTISLENYLEENNYVFYCGLGVPRDTNWQAEKSYFIHNISLEKATEIAVIYEQNAFVFGKQHQLAELIHGYLK